MKELLCIVVSLKFLGCYYGILAYRKYDAEAALKSCNYQIIAFTVQVVNYIIVAIAGRIYLMDLLINLPLNFLFFAVFYWPTSVMKEELEARQSYSRPADIYYG